MSVDYEDVVKRIQNIYNNCSPIEQNTLTQILQEICDKGYSETYEQIYLVDFKEVPVSVETFLCNPNYLGATNDCGKMIYQGWWRKYIGMYLTFRKR